MSERIPKYLAIAKYYRSKVLSGELPPGTPLESRRAMAKLHKTSRVTVDQAVQYLTTDGILEPSEGNRPPVVADPSRRIATVCNRVESSKATGRALAPNETSRILSVRMVPCPPDIAPLLRVEAGTEVLCRERLNLVDGEPVATGRSYYPPEVSRVTPELSLPKSLPKPGSRELAAERMGSRQKHVNKTFTARLATDRERELLGLRNPYTVVLQAARTVLLANGKVVEVGLKIHEGDRPVSVTVPL